MKTPGPRPDRSDRHRLPPAAERELEETLFEEGVTTEEKARRLFVHGLLREQEELGRPDASARREIRIQGILQGLSRSAPVLDDSDDGTETVAVLPHHRTHLRLWITAAAAVLLAFGALFWLSGGQGTALPELLAMARENHSKGLQIYRGYVDTSRGKQKFDLALAEGGKAQIHLETKRGNFDFGSTGKMGWFKTPIGKAVEVPLFELAPLLDTLPESLKSFSPDLSYLDVEGLLAKILTEEGMRITGHEKDEQGQELVVLEGRFRVLGRAPHRHGRHRARRDSRQKLPPRQAKRRVYTGSVKIRISPDRGWIHDIRFKNDQHRTETLLERVLSLPGEDLSKQPKWLDFEPEFTKSVPYLRLWRFMGTFLERARKSSGK